MAGKCRSTSWRFPSRFTNRVRRAGHRRNGARRVAHRRSAHRGRLVRSRPRAIAGARRCCAAARHGVVPGRRSRPSVVRARSERREHHLSYGGQRHRARMGSVSHHERRRDAQRHHGRGEVGSSAAAVEQRRRLWTVEPVRRAAPRRAHGREHRVATAARDRLLRALEARFRSPGFGRARTGADLGNGGASRRDIWSAGSPLRAATGDVDQTWGNPTVERRQVYDGHRACGERR